MAKKPHQPDQDPQDLILSDSSPFAAQEAYRTLRTNLVFSLPGNGAKTIVITSTNQGESKSTTAVNLGIVFAQSGAKTLIIDCDLRLPTAARKLGVSPTPGLSNLLVGMCTMSQALHHIQDHLDLLPSGDVPPDPTELLGSSKMQRVLEAARDSYDYIIIDTPPVCVVSDAALLYPHCSGVLLVCRQGIAKRDSIQDALRQISLSGTKMLGFALTCVTSEKKGYGRSDYSSYYGQSARNKA